MCAIPQVLTCDEGLGRADLNLDGGLPCVWQAIPIFIPLPIGGGMQSQAPLKLELQP